MTIVNLRLYLALRISSKSWILQATRGAFYFECVATVLLWNIRYNRFYDFSQKESFSFRCKIKIVFFEAKRLPR